MTWRETWPPHPAAEVFPMLDGPEMDELTKDIRENGVRIPPVLYNDGERIWTLDGRNRLEAAERVGRLDVQTVTVTLERRDVTDPISYVIDPISYVIDPISYVIDPISYVRSANAYRRHLTREQKAEAIRRLLQLAPERSNSQIARDVGSTHPTVARVRREEEERGDVERLSTRTDSRGRRQPVGHLRPWRSGVTELVKEQRRTEPEPSVLDAWIEQQTAALAVRMPLVPPTVSPEQQAGIKHLVASWRARAVGAETKLNNAIGARSAEGQGSLPIPGEDGR